MRGRNPNLNQKKLLERNGMESKEWLVLKVFKDKILIKNKITGEERDVNYG